ncbi:Gfo/Idh/MocA family oxidoreductase [Heyndrickxia sporothermodurans]|uniref:Gfo/Idh/MocA family protein n=1 Tax=Heyndrickxia sporothermodurans TaxID=46224 RepID=UPI002DBE550C|nr:Gfo/Idh/MocA family oxidoreductase [Heyndrickxia sporothermodurans]MEB6550237.1 Gfo/Idh/MocA family oxidoreductase [Heyndrickxia sporothermodurans]
MTIHFGIIGCGYISKRHIESLATCKDAKLVAVSDLQKDRMKEAALQYTNLANEHHPIHLYENYTELIESDEVDAVVICTISGLHAEIAKIALIAGKHVILEKPMTLSLKEADELNQLAKANQCKIVVCHQMRFKPIMKKIKQVIQDGKIGKPYLGIVSIRLNRSPDYYASAPWRGDWENDGGMLVNQGIHLIDLMQWFLGDVEKVYGDISSFSKTKETEDIALGVLTFSNKAKGLIEANVITQPKNLGHQLSIFGEKGCISLEGPSLNQISRWYIVDEETDYEHLNELLKDNNEQVYMYENFIHTVQYGDEKLLIDGYEGKKALETIFAIYQSYLTKKVIDLPLNSFSTANMKNEGGSE